VQHKADYTVPYQVSIIGFDFLMNLEFRIFPLLAIKLQKKKKKKRKRERERERGRENKIR
jgi:hypothetical protein